MALVVILALLVLITAVVMAFFVHATSNRIVEASRTSHTKASLLGKAAADYVVGKILEEIADPANNSLISTNHGVVIYSPKEGTNAVAHREVATANRGNADFLALIRQSVPGADANASSVSTGLEAKNGRKMDASRWNQPRLLTGAGFASDDQIPRWIYVTESGPTNAPSTNTIGRFAYNVYETGGLLNVNVAGYPTGINAADLKGTAAGADMTELGVSQGDVDDLVRFRNSTAGTYADLVAAGAHGGFLSLFATNSAGTAVFTNNYFTSRQDLLRYTQVQSPALTNALPYLTHFSRALNAPSWSPGTNAPAIAYKDDAGKTTSINRNLPHVRAEMASSVAHYRDDGTATPYSVQAGDPLLQRRFSLAKLAWIAPDGPKSTDLVGAIQACFGLRWDGANGRWNYVGSSGAIAQSSIKTLAEVAAENREPNFFETLKAGILSGSLGQQPGAYPGLSGAWGGASGTAGPVGALFDQYSAIADRQVIQIGAAIIDQYDVDSYPTAIYFSTGVQDPEASSAANELFNTVYGTENLPFLTRLLQITMSRKNMRTATPPTTPDKMSAWLQPEIWNPHRSPGTNVTGPTRFRVRTYGRAFTRWEQVGVSSGMSAELLYEGSDAEKGRIYFDATGNAFRNNPELLTVNNTTAPTVPDNLSQPGDPYTGGKFAGIFTGEVSYAPNIEKTNPILVRSVLNYRSNLAKRRGITVSLEYLDAHGSWRPYNVMARLTITENNTQAMADNSGVLLPKAKRIDNAHGWDQGVSLYGRPDPRTDRFSVSEAYNSLWANNSTMQPNDATSYRMWKWWPRTSGFSPNPGSGTAALFSGDWAKNLSSGRSWYGDPDGTVRPGDAFRASGNEGNPLFHGGMTDARRPVVLNRAFRSVAELGYAYRDLPFKTLDFWSSKSGDSALLDLFCLEDEPDVSAGLVNPNTAPEPVLRALFAGGAKTAFSDGGVITSGEAGNLAQAVVATVASSPLFSRADLVNTLSDVLNGAASSVADKANKTRGEAPVRALASVANTRTWNFMIDVVAQSGRFPAQGATDGASFLVEGERRYWLHIAIDRYTGKIVDQQLELVSE